MILNSYKTLFGTMKESTIGDVENIIELLNILLDPTKIFYKFM